MRRNWLIGAMIIGGVVLVIPTLLLMFFRHTPYAGQPAPFQSPYLWASLVSSAVGIFLSFWSVALFAQVGRGTPSFWSPPQKLLVLGPYQYLRNPMVVGLLLILFAESLFFQSIPLAIWASANTFFHLSVIFLLEEPALYAQFGEPYLRYKAHVPRFFPRLRPWSPTSSAQSHTATLDLPALPLFQEMLSPSPLRSLAPTISQPKLAVSESPSTVSTSASPRVPSTPTAPSSAKPALPRFRAHVPNCPLIHLWRDIISHGAPSELWLTRCQPRPEVDPMRFAWEHALYGEHMLMLLSRTEHPQKSLLQRKFWWFFREYEVGQRGQMLPGGDNVAPLIREIVPEPPSLEETIRAFRTPPPRCPIAEFLAALQFRPDAIAAWSDTWGEHGDPLQSAWNAARSAQSMSHLLEHFYSPRYATKIRAKLITRLGGSLEEFTEEECANALKEIEPHPPRFEDVMARADALRESLLGEKV